MDVRSMKVVVQDLAKGYKDCNINDDTWGYDMKLNIRPAYQRNFVYNEEQQQAVIDTVIKGYPLNVFYWSWNPNEERYDLIDGQQRTLSILRYINQEYAYHGKYFKSLPLDIQNKILNYKIDVFVCEGTESEKLAWFKTINTAGEKLTPQELLNSQFTGPWLSDAKDKFAKRECAAVKVGEGYVVAALERQEWLEIALQWICEDKGIPDIQNYMSIHQHDSSAYELLAHFRIVIGWVQRLFPKWRKEMQGLNWGKLYAKYKNVNLDPTEAETKIMELMKCPAISNKRGIYQYLLSGNEKYLSVRQFDDRQKAEMFERQEGKCKMCKKEFDDYKKMHADHVIPWSKGGRTETVNGQMLCPDCNLKKSNKL